MIERVDANLVTEFEKFGKSNWNDCFHCGNCTGACPLTEQHFLFPRKSYNEIQMGLKDSLASSIEPWLCYYCGDCSEKCPRDANPAETMMILRRYLTSVYDWTGLSKKFYTSHWWEYIAILFIGAIVTLLLGVINPNGIVTELNSNGGVKINEMFPVHWVHIGDTIMALTIGILLVSNLFRMWYFVILRDKSVKIPISAYIKGVKELAIHFATQKRFNKCDDKKYWGAHWILMTAYSTMLVIIIFFLPWFQTEDINAWYHPQRLFGYYATFGLFLGLIYFFIGRIKKERQMFKYSHLSDWLFIILLFLSTLTGILLHIFRLSGLAAETYYMYIIHMAILVPMLVIEVPFSKWSHLAYRPFTVYFSLLKKSALIKKNTKN
ncbi:4Fe-4S dicluster domain-containing protein [Bacteroidota bacterium]